MNQRYEFYVDLHLTKDCDAQAELIMLAFIMKTQRKITINSLHYFLWNPEFLLFMSLR